ncbi:MAG: hypothetical protein ACFCU2_04135 [Acidimicrobiia bacterium]
MGAGDLASKCCHEVAGGIPTLTAITFGHDGSIWAASNSPIPGLADVSVLP